MVELGAAAVAERLAETNVLLVDDDASTRKLVKAQLTGMGVSGRLEAADGMAGFEPSSLVKIPTWGTLKIHPFNHRA